MAIELPKCQLQPDGTLWLIIAAIISKFSKDMGSWNCQMFIRWSQSAGEG
jgi:hypothetical protein